MKFQLHAMNAKKQPTAIVRTTAIVALYCFCFFSFIACFSVKADHGACVNGKCECFEAEKVCNLAIQSSFEDKFIVFDTFSSLYFPPKYFGQHCEYGKDVTILTFFYL